MDLFDIIPDNFFSPLASTNKRTYLKALFVLHRQFKFDWRIKKEELVYVLADALSSDASYFSFNEEGEDEDRSYSGFAHILLRKLEASGWIEYEYGEADFDQYVIIPEYGVLVLETLQAIMANDSVEYNSYVYSTYSSLKMADESGSDYYHALITAHSSTHELLMKLKILLNNIKRFQRRLSDHKAVQALVREHFEDFKAGVSDKIYHPLKTFDSVPRFKTPILNILNRWILEDTIIDQIHQDGLRRGRFESDGFAVVLSMMTEVIDIYEKINDLLTVIDGKYTAYTRAAVERIEYMLNVDGTTRSRLVQVLQKIPKDRSEGYEVALSPVLNLTEESLYSRKKQGPRAPAETLSLADGMDEMTLASEITGMQLMMDSAYSNQRVQAYIEGLLAKQNVLSARDVALESDEDYIRLILGSLQHDDRRSTYTLTYDRGKVLKGWYHIPNLTIRKKVK